MPRKTYKFDWDDSKGQFKQSETFKEESTAEARLMAKKLQKLVIDHSGLRKPNIIWLILSMAVLTVCGYTASFILFLNNKNGWGRVGLVLTPVGGFILISMRWRYSRRAVRVSKWIEDHALQLQQLAATENYSVNIIFVRGSSRITESRNYEERIGMVQ